jgi:transposase
VNTKLLNKLSDVLTYKQMLFLSKRLPQPHKETGRPAYSNLELLPGILKVLRSGCRWRDLDRAYFNRPSGITHWRRFRFWRRSKAFKLLWDLILKRLAGTGKLDLSIGTQKGFFRTFDTAGEFRVHRLFTG